jgi:hypothetical protein
MKLFGAGRRALIALGAVILVSPAASAPQAGKLGALARLEPGQWQLRDLDNARAAPQSMCVADGGGLVQIRHRGAPCSRLVISQDQEAATVHYTCPANGFGRTSVRVETPRLAQIDTQGIINNAPFAYRAEARRVGPCRG